MAGTPVNSPLGALAFGAAKLGLKTIMTAVSNSQSLVERIAEAVYEEETGGKYSRLTTEQRVLWTNRVRAVIRAASNMVNV